MWQEQAAWRVDAATIIAERRRASAHGRKLADSLRKADIGKFVAVQN